MDFGGHDRIETHGTVHMLGVEYADGTRTVTMTQSELLPQGGNCLLYTSPSPRDRQKSRMPSSA